MAKKKGKKVAQKQGANRGTGATSKSTYESAGWDDHIARLLRTFVAGALGAAVLNLLVWTLSLGLFNINTMVVPPGATAAQQLSPIAVLLASIIPALGAAIVYHFMSRNMGKRAWNVFVTVAVVLTILSFIPVLTLPVSSGSKVVLILMHIVSAVGILWGIKRTLGYFPETISGPIGATN